MAIKEKFLGLSKELANKLVGYQRVESFTSSVVDWSNIFQLLQLNSRTTVVELGSGISPKIQFALSSIGFRGHLTIIDVNQRALAAQRIAAFAFNHPFEMDTSKVNLFDYFYHSGNIIVGNHALDDIIAWEFARRFKVEYRTIYSNPELQRKFWNDVETEGKNAKETLNKLASKMNEMNQGGVVVMNNYSSLFDVQHNIESRTRYCNHALDELYNELMSYNFQDIRLCLDIPNSRRKWLIAKKNEC